jgi:hypothetical protein
MTEPKHTPEPPDDRDDLIHLLSLLQTAARRYAQRDDVSSRYVLSICDRVRAAVATARLQPITGLITPEATGHSVDLERDCGCRVLAGPILVYCPLHGAAPDLRAALQWAVEACTSHNEGRHVDYDWIGEAMSAIAKATRQGVPP